MSIWQIQVYKVAVWSNPGRRHVPEEEWWDIQRTAKHILHLWWYFIMGYDADGTDHDRTLCRIFQTYRNRKWKPKT